MNHTFRITTLLMTLATALGANGSQQNEYCKQDEYYEQSESCEQAPAPSCCRKRHGHRWGDDPNWRDDRFAEEQYHDTGWPGRRGDELSDQLSR